MFYEHMRVGSPVFLHTSADLLFLVLVQNKDRSFKIATPIASL